MASESVVTRSTPSPRRFRECTWLVRASKRPKIQKETTHVSRADGVIPPQAEKQIVVTETHAKEQERIAYSLEAEMATFKN